MAQACQHRQQQQVEGYVGNCCYQQMTRCARCGTTLAYGAQRIQHTPTPYVFSYDEQGRAIIHYRCAVCGMGL